MFRSPLASSKEKTIDEIVEAYRLALLELSNLTDELSFQCSPRSPCGSKNGLTPRTPTSPRSLNPALAPIQIHSPDDPSLDVLFVSGASHGPSQGSVSSHLPTLQQAPQYGTSEATFQSQSQPSIQPGYQHLPDFGSSLDDESAGDGTCDETRDETGFGRPSRKTSTHSSQSGTASAYRISIFRPSAVLPDHWKRVINNARRGDLSGEEMKAVFFYCDVISSIMILCNLAFLGWQLQHFFAVGEDLQSASTFDIIFCVLLFIEILIRMFLERRSFVFGESGFMNMFDIVVLIGMVIETGIEFESTEDIRQLAMLRAVSLIRALRIFRFAKLFRLLHKFHAGRLIAMSLAHGYTAFAWIGILTAGSAYAFCLIVASRSTYYCYDHESDDELLCKYFDSMWTSFSSVYQAMMGGIRWGALYDALQVLEPFYCAALCVFITFYYAVFLQIVTGIFVGQVLREEHAIKDEDAWRIRQIWEEKFVSEMSEHFKRLDVNNNGVLCKDELDELFHDDAMASFLSRNGLDTNSGETLFEILDCDGSGQVDFFEFASGCTQYRGQATAVNLEKVRRDIQNLQSEVLLALGCFPTKLRRKGTDESSATQRMKPAVSIPATSPELEATVAGQERENFVKRIKSEAYSGNSGSRRSALDEVEFLNAESSKNPGIIIELTELRAMLLHELEDVATLINASCEEWVDMTSSELLIPSKVNLYHFNYYSISPKTAAASMTIKGLNEQSYKKGGLLKQLHPSDSRTLGEACILQEVCGSDVRVRILRGQFFPQCKVHYEDKECGMVERIEFHGKSISYKELVGSGPARPDWFCSHWWGECIQDFVACCRTHSQKRNKDKYWVCAYANRQHELSSDINDDPEETSFRKAMALAEGVLLVLDSDATPFKRIWCDFEIFKTISEGKKLDIVTCTDKPHLLTEMPLPEEHTFDKTRRERHFPLQVLRKGMQVQLENGKATMQQDKINILNSMGKDPQTGLVSDDLCRKNVDSANRALRGYFALAAWPQAVKRGLVQNFSFKAGEAMNLAQIVCADQGRSFLQLTLSGLEEMNDVEMKSIAECLPPSLSHLNLGLENCAHITDAGVSSVAAKLQTLPLQKLELDFVSCYNLTDASLLALASQLPSTLVEIKVHFDHCSAISKGGVRKFSDGLPGSVKSLIATFKKTNCNEAFMSVQQLRKMKTPSKTLMHSFSLF